MIDLYALKVKHFIYSPASHLDVNNKTNFMHFKKDK